MPDLPADAGHNRPCFDLSPDEPGAGSESHPPPPMRVVVQGGWGGADDLAGETPHSAPLRRSARSLARP